MYYYPTGGVSDYLFGAITSLMLIIAVVFLYRIDKNKDYSKYHDKEFLRTLELVELRFLIPGADGIEEINQVIEEKTRKTKKP